jgi:hypothetical protein
MRNQDKRLDTVSIKEIFGDVRDYPLGFEPGRSLAHYKRPMPYNRGEETSKFYANGIGRKNRMQGNDFVKSGMYKHGITCVNCHEGNSDDWAQQKMSQWECYSGSEVSLILNSL